MRRNKIPLSVFVGMKTSLLGLLFLSLGILLSEGIHGQMDFVQLTIVLTTFFTGGGFLISGIGLMLKKPWARILSNIVIILLSALVLIGVYLLVMEMRFRPWEVVIIQLGIITFVFSTVAGLFLVLNNTRIIDELEGESEEASLMD